MASPPSAPAGWSGLSIEGLTSFSVAPLRSPACSACCSPPRFLFGAFDPVGDLDSTARTVPGYPSLVIGLMTIGGVQLLMIGVVGEYIGKILSELKARPIYFVAEHSVKNAGASAKESKARPAVPRAAE
jgi:hypothetical protein